MPLKIPFLKLIYAVDLLLPHNMLYFLFIYFFKKYCEINISNSVYLLFFSQDMIVLNLIELFS